MYKELEPAQSKRLQYTKEQLLALQASPLVSKPASLPPLSQWLNRDPTNRHILNHHSATVPNRFAQPKASVSTPSRSSKYSKATSGLHSHHKDQLQGSIYEGQQQQQQQSIVSSNCIKNNHPDEEALPEWMDDNPSDLTKDEQTEKMVLDSSHLEAWKLRMKQMDDTNKKGSNNRHDDNNNNNSTRLAADCNSTDSLLALESLHLSTTSSNNSTAQDDIGSYSAKTISVHDLFQQHQHQHQHLPSPPSLSPLARQQQQQQQQTNSSSSAIGTPSYLLSPRDDQIGGFGQILSKQLIINKDDNETFMANGGFMNVTQHHHHHQDNQRPPPGFMSPSPGHSRPPPMMSTSFSTGTTGSHHHHQQQYHHYRQYPMLPEQQQQQPMLSPSILLNSNTNNSMIPSFPLFHHQHPPPSMLFNSIQQPGLPSQTQPFLHHHQQQSFIPPPPPPSDQHHFMPQMHTFPSQLLHHPYHQPLAGQPLVSDLNK